MKNVLVFPCGSEIGLEVNRALAFSTHFTLFGGNSEDDHGRFVYKNYISGMPFIDSPDFVPSLNKIIEDYCIDFVIPAHDTAVLKMAEYQSAVKASVITSCERTCKVCRSKKATYELFEHQIPTPRVFRIVEAIDYPVFLKPDVGQGSKGTQKVFSKEELDFYINKDPTLLAIEFLPGKEYTIDCFTDKHGKLLFAEGRERSRINNGISVHSKPSNHPIFKHFAELINKTLSFQGVWFFQVKERADGELVLMEISPRIAGTMALFRALGVNFIQLSLFDRMGLDVGVLVNKLDMEIDRALFARFSIKEQYDCVYVDFDDTIIMNQFVNTDIIKFLYQARNMGKKIILLTKHKYDIKESLCRYAISELLFDEILLLEPSQHKRDVIKNLKSIFIDDSYDERKKVHDALNIPVFAVDAVESLLYWKV